MDNPILSFAVSHKAEENAWSSLVQLCANLPVGMADVALLQLEEEFKAQTGEKRLPARYRSAKSTICKALSVGVPLLDMHGLPIPKTRLGTMIKGSTPISSRTITECQKEVQDTINKLLALQSYCSIENDYNLFDDIRKELSHAGYL